tara:strand:+ start:41813 stop:42415 length:603 start_codon:yes stop_codon:yes gene_type:complete
VRLFAEPGTEISPEYQHLPVTQHDATMLAFPNWYLALTEMFLREPKAEAYLICQDDVLFARGIRDYLEAKLWPANDIGVVSLYCPSHEHRNGISGFRLINPGWGAWGALAYLFSNPGIRSILADEKVLNHRHAGPANGERNIDSIVGDWCRRQKLPYFVHLPSLAQHIGRTSTIWSSNNNRGRRRAIEFTGTLPSEATSE